MSIKYNKPNLKNFFCCCALGVTLLAPISEGMAETSNNNGVNEIKEVQMDSYESLSTEDDLVALKSDGTNTSIKNKESVILAILALAVIAYLRKNIADSDKSTSKSGKSLQKMMSRKR